MALLTPEPPIASRQGLQDGLRQLSARAGTPLLGGAPTSGMGQAQQVFNISLDDLAGQATLDSAKPTGWRYLMTNSRRPGGGAVGVIDVSEVGDEHRFAQMHDGSLPEDTRKAVDIAKALPEVETGSYELRGLRVPSLQVDALWLKDTQGPDDLVVPIRSAAKKLIVGTPYKAADFMADLREIAAAKPKFDDRPKYV